MRGAGADLARCGIVEIHPADLDLELAIDRPNVDAGPPKTMNRFPAPVFLSRSPPWLDRGSPGSAEPGACRGAAFRSDGEAVALRGELPSPLTAVRVEGEAAHHQQVEAGAPESEAGMKLKGTP
jgi:hypothetical protein